MLDRIRQLFAADRHRPGNAGAGAPRIPDGERVYAIGDVHGRLDLFEALIAAIEADDAARGPSDTLIVLLGDLVDRGPDSAGVVAAARALAERREVRALMGNHEEMFLRALDDEQALRQFLRVGGKETVLSYGIERQHYRSLELGELLALLNERVPVSDRAFLLGMEDHVAVGDYVFVHAGIRPGIDMAEQKQSDMRWIREPFLSHPHPHEACVVHGHTIRRAVEFWPHERAPNRIGIDTGAYDSGRLTAIGLQGADRWFMDTAD